MNYFGELERRLETLRSVLEDEIERIKNRAKKNALPCKSQNCRTRYCHHARPLPFLGLWQVCNILVVAAGLNDFQLKGKAEVAYWPKIRELIGRDPVRHQ